MNAAEHFTEGERLLDLAESTSSRDAAAVYAVRAQAHFEAASTLLMAASILPTIGYDPLKQPTRTPHPTCKRGGRHLEHMVELGLSGDGEYAFCPGRS